MKIVVISSFLSVGSQFYVNISPSCLRKGFYTLSGSFSGTYLLNLTLKVLYFIEQLIPYFLSQKRQWFRATSDRIHPSFLKQIVITKVIWYNCRKKCYLVTSSGCEFPNSLRSNLIVLIPLVLNPILLDLKTISIPYLGIESALDVFQKYRFSEYYTSLFGT